MSVLRRKPLFSIFHHPCAWANSPWLTKCESNNFGWAAKERWSQIFLWKRRTQLWWRWLVDRSGFWSFLSPSFFSLFHSPLSYPHGTAQHCQKQGLEGQGDECCVFKVNRSWFLRVHGGVTACAELLHVLKLDLTPCLLWRWNPWQVIILLSHIISDSLSTSLPAKSQLLGKGKKERKKELRKPRRSEIPWRPTAATPGVFLGFHCKTGNAGVLKHWSLDQS